VPGSRRLLILGGTGEARALADALAGRAELTVVTSLAGRTVAPRRPQGELRIGGFGGAAGLARYLEEAEIDLVIDASHPYASTISGHAVEACSTSGRPLLRLERPAWQPQHGDRWILVDSLPAAAEAAPSLGERVFLTIGVKELAAFAGIEPLWFLIRLVDAPEEAPPLRDYEIVLGRGPFQEIDECELMRDRGIDLVIAKNSGGDATYGKIAAARALGLPVLLLRRPSLPPADTTQSIAAAVDWVTQQGP
jgi:precorrin-6A/cobalt-precorrin-6A reductase